MDKIPVLPINTFLEENKADFYANNIVNHCFQFHNSIKIPHKHDSYLVVLFTNGSGIHEIDFHTFEINKGSVFMLNPGQTHHWELSEDIEGYIFVHNQSFYDLYFSKNRITQFPFFYSTQNTPCITIEENHLKSIIALFETIVKEYDSKELMSYQKIRNLVDITYIELSRLYINKTDLNGSTNNHYNQKLHQLEQFIETHYLEEKSPSKYAEWMNMSPKHLNRIVKNLLNKTTQDLIIERIILEAKRMLVQPENSVSDVSLHLGYDDNSYFSRLFKKRCNETPTEFSNRYK